MSQPHYTCPHCRGFVPAAPFCSQCGYQFAQAPQAPPAKKPFPVWKIVAIVLGVLMAPCAVCVPLAWIGQLPSPWGLNAKPEVTVTWTMSGSDTINGYVGNNTDRVLRDVILEGTATHHSNPSGVQWNTTRTVLRASFSGSFGRVSDKLSTDISPGEKKGFLFYGASYSKLSDVQVTELNVADYTRRRLNFNEEKKPPPGF